CRRASRWCAGSSLCAPRTVLLIQRGAPGTGLSERRRVIRWRYRGERSLRPRRPGVMAGPLTLLAPAGRPSGEREVHGERDRDVRLSDKHGARLGQRRALALRGRQVPVLRTHRLGGIQPPGHSDRAVGQYSPFDLARGLLGADQDDSKRAAALGQVKQDLLDRAVALQRRVLVELV